jgi:hypothetical protein
MVKVKDVYPIDTVVRLRKTGQFALIKQRTFLNSENFLNYLAMIEGRGDGLYCLFHEDIDLEALPKEVLNPLENS